MKQMRYCRTNLLNEDARTTWPAASWLGPHRSAPNAKRALSCDAIAMLQRHSGASELPQSYHWKITRCRRDNALAWRCYRDSTTLPQ